MAASATFALKAGVWFRRGRRCMVSPDSLGTACPPSGRNSTYRPVQILEAGSYHLQGLILILNPDLPVQAPYYVAMLARPKFKRHVNIKLVGKFVRIIDCKTRARFRFI